MENVDVIYSPSIIRDTKTKLYRKRIWELDFLRGICILLMCFDHTIFNFAATFADAWKATGNPVLASLVEFAKWYWVHPARHAVQEIVLWIFFSLCGISVVFTRNAFRHSIKILIAAALITVATLIAVNFGMDKGFAIRFGVLHMLGTASFIVAIIYSFTKKNKWLNFAVFSLIALALFLLDILYLSNGRYHTDIHWMCMFHENLGSIEHFSPGDCFPLIPSAIKVFVGAALAPLLYGKRKSLLPKLEGNWYKPVNFIGRHTLWVVILHQPVIIGIIALINFIFIIPGSFGII